MRDVLNSVLSYISGLCTAAVELHKDTHWILRLCRVPVPSRQNMWPMLAIIFRTIHNDQYCMVLVAAMNYNSWCFVFMTQWAILLNDASYSAFPSSCNVRLQEREPCHPIKLLNDLNSALWLAHTVDAVATGSCKNLEKHCNSVVWKMHCKMEFRKQVNIWAYIHQSSF